MFAVTAARISADDPLSGLELGERAGPGGTGRLGAGARSRRPRSTTMTCGRCAGWASPRTGCRSCSAATRPGVDADGNEVIVHAVIGDPDAGGGDETLDPRRSLLSERYDGTFAERVAVPAAQPGAQARRAVLRGGGLPADGLPDRLPDAVREVRRPARRDGAGAGRRRRRGHRADPARPRRRLPDLGHQPQRGQARARARARRRPGLRVRRPAARAGRRGHGDGRARPPGRTRSARSSPAAGS